MSLCVEEFTACVGRKHMVEQRHAATSVNSAKAVLRVDQAPRHQHIQQGQPPTCAVVALKHPVGAARAKVLLLAAVELAAGRGRVGAQARHSGGRGPAGERAPVRGEGLYNMYVCV